jgi:hypothetical protein
MTGGNVIDLAARRGQAALETAAARNAQRHAHRDKEATELLDKVGATKRMAEGDRPVLARNLGRLVAEIDPGNAMAVAKRILDSEWPKRKRYIRFPKDAFDPSARYAASGGTFARLIRQLVEEKVRKGFTRAQAMSELVHGALKGTSFRAPSPFQMTEGADDAAILVERMERVLDKLAQEADLVEYFKLVSKYPIHPLSLRLSSHYRSSRSLELSAGEEPNDLYDWDSLLDEEYEFQSWLPWWAPKCVIGHLYIPFECSCLHLPEHAIALMKETCGGEITRHNWDQECSMLLWDFLSPEWIHPRTVHHRLPVWLVLLPSRTKLIPCLYATTRYEDRFQTKMSLANEGTYYSYHNSTALRFVDHIGERVDDDADFFYDWEEESFYVRLHETGIYVIGSGVGEDTEANFKAEIFDPLWDDLPEWLQTHPVQKILKLTTESDAAKLFALSPRGFPKNSASYANNDGSIFRPAFSDTFSRYTPLMPNTIAAYLLRNSIETSGITIFDALKNDALAKGSAARELVNCELSKFQAAFDKRYGK